MEIQKIDLETMYKCVPMRQLGNGRRYKMVLVGDSEDARTSTFYFVGNIYQNWPSWKRLVIKNGENLKVLDLPTPTVNGKRVHFFFWNELTADLWFRQIEREKLIRWFETATPEDGIAMGQLIFEEGGSEHRLSTKPLPFLSWTVQQVLQMNIRQIQMEIMKLGLPALRRLKQPSPTPATGPEVSPGPFL